MAVECNKKLCSIVIGVVVALFIGVVVWSQVGKDPQGLLCFVMFFYVHKMCIRLSGLMHNHCKNTKEFNYVAVIF